MTPRTQRLLRDLLALYAKYGHAEFDNALAALRSGAAIELLSSTVEVLTKSTPTHPLSASQPLKRKASPRDRFDDLQLRLTLDRAHPTGELQAFLEQIIDRSILPNPRALREFAEMLRIPTGQKVERYTIARKIGEALASESEEVQQRRFQMARDMSAESSSLQNWANIIVKR